MNDERENLSWQVFGEASRELAKIIAADGFQPDLILSIARGGLFLAGSLGDAVADTGQTIELVHTFIKDQVEDVRSAVIYEKSQSVIKCEYVWKRTDRWI